MPSVDGHPQVVGCTPAAVASAHLVELNVQETYELWYLNEPARWATPAPLPETNARRVATAVWSVQC
jgi:hypothetical protein